MSFLFLETKGKDGQRSRFKNAAGNIPDPATWNLLHFGPLGSDRTTNNGSIATGSVRHPGSDPLLFDPDPDPDPTLF